MVWLLNGVCSVYWNLCEGCFSLFDVLLCNTESSLAIICGQGVRGRQWWMLMCGQSDLCLPEVQYYVVGIGKK